MTLLAEVYEVIASAPDRFHSDVQTEEGILALVIYEQDINTH